MATTTTSHPTHRASHDGGDGGGAGSGQPSAQATHTEREDHPWEINIPDHAQRADSPTYVISRKLMNDIAGEAGPIARFLGGEGPYQDHHGGGLWVKDAQGWLFVKNLAGIEWSQQFCADPAKVETLRQYAERIYKAFPATIPALKQLLHGKKYPLEEILTTPIKTQDDVARWVDSIFNACVPLGQRRHTGVLVPNGDQTSHPVDPVGGVHHYPTPITDIQLFKHDDFQLWVVDNEGELAAVTPAYKRGSGKSEVNVAYATPGTQLERRWIAAHQKGRRLTLPGDNSLAKQAFVRQQGNAKPA